MDVLLINTPISKENRDPDAGNSVPPIGMGYIYTQLTLSGYECQFIDAFADSLLPDEICENINHSDAEYVGLNVFSSNYHIARYVVENVDSPRKFLLGGPAVRWLVPEIKNWNPRGGITVVTGESELILPEIIKRSSRAEKYPSNLDVVDVIPPSPFFPFNIDLQLNRSIFKNEPVKRPDLGLIESHIVTSRGCPYNCAFCTAAKSLNPQIKPRFRTYDKLAKEIETILKLHPETNCIRILDDLFIRDCDSIELAIRLFAEAKLHWRSMAHINTFRNLPEKYLDGIKKSGCRELFVGIESGNDEILKHMRKPFSADTAYKTVSRILDAQIPVKCYFILGFLGETEAALIDTVTFASRLKDYADKTGAQFRVSPFRFRPYHGTALYNELINNGWEITQIENRIDTSKADTFDPYDCISGVYAEFDEDTLNKYMSEMEKLNAY